jgi:light-regulated signal transduction histidine kinase (bacteriophytochrome)
LRLTSDKIILSRTSIPEFEEELTAQTELSLCRKIVEKHGGNLAVQFQDDNKLTYFVWLPA